MHLIDFIINLHLPLLRHFGNYIILIAIAITHLTIRIPFIKREAPQKLVLLARISTFFN